MYVFQVLDVIAPPYTTELMQSLLPLIENDEITGSLKTDEENDNVSQFIGRFSQGQTVFMLLPNWSQIFLTLYFYDGNYSSKVRFLANYSIS